LRLLGGGPLGEERRASSADLGTQRRVALQPLGRGTSQEDERLLLRPGRRLGATLGAEDGQTCRRRRFRFGEDGGLVGVEGCAVILLQEGDGGAEIDEPGNEGMHGAGLVAQARGGSMGQPKDPPPLGCDPWWWYSASNAVTDQTRRPDAVDKAVALLAMRERTRHELAQALHARGYSPAELETAVDRVAALGYLDDRRVAARRAEQLLAGGYGRAVVLRKLLGQGVDALVADEVLRRAIDAGHDEEKAARALLVSRRLSGPRGARFLARRGFDEALIRRLLDLGDGE
jgi:regulatory protein